MEWIIYIVLISSTCCYSILNYVVKKLSKHSLTDKKEWVFRNTGCSCIHSIVSALATSYCIYNNPGLMKNLITAHSMLSSIVIASSGGYFMYDTVDILYNEGLKQWILLIHHFVILFGFPYCIATTTYHGFAISALLMEWNSIFLHTRKMLQMTGESTICTLYRLNSILLAITMLLFRYLLCVYLVYKIWTDRTLMSWLPFLIGLSSTVIFIPANIGLCYRVYTKDFGSRWNRKKNQ